MRVRPCLAAATLLLPALLAAAMPAEAATTRVLTITNSSAHPAHAFKAFDGDPPKLFDFNHDGRMEIVVQNDNRYVYVFDSKTGALRGELTTTYPSGWGARSINGPEVNILVRGGVPFLVLANSAAFLTVFKYGGVASTGKFLFTKVWERRLSDCHSNPGMDAKPVLADLDKDGDFEILAQTEEVGVFALRYDGSTYWKRCIGGGNAEPGVGDLNADGWPDVVWTSDTGVVTASDGRTGNTRWTFWAGASTYGLGSASFPVGPAVTQLDGRGGADVVVGARDSSDCTHYANNHATLFALSGTGALLWRRQPPNATPLTYTHAIVWDVDNNGQKDVLWADWNTQGHVCGNWEVVGQSHVYRIDAAGNLRWTITMGAWWNNKDLALADVDADGVQEVLANGPSGGNDGIWYLNSRTGAKEAFVSASPWKLTRGPVVANLWGEGTMQWVVPVQSLDDTQGAVLVYNTGVAYNAAWPHLPYPTL